MAFLPSVTLVGHGGKAFFENCLDRFMVTLYLSIGLTIDVVMQFCTSKYYSKHRLFNLNIAFLSVRKGF